MAELIRNLQELQALPEDVHWFCPRSGVDDYGYYYDEDLHGQVDDEDPAARERRHKKTQKAEARKVLALDSLQILAFDGTDAAPYQKWLKGRLDSHMTSCDVCIRVYHRARAELKQRLEEQYDEEEVARFLELFDQMNIERIKHGLDRAASDLIKVAPPERGINALDPVGLYAIFETLSCEPFLQDQALLVQHFDKPFQLVQTNKRLRLNSYTPAMTRFLFSTDENRYTWAFTTWSRFKRNLTSMEFEWTVRQPLFNAMTRVQVIALGTEFLPLFWSGARLIVSKLDKDLITHSLRAIDIDIYKLALDHMQVDSECFKDLLATVQQLLEKSPTDFWDAMGAISPVTILEQVFNSPSLERILLQVKDEGTPAYELTDEVFSWIAPFLSSIKASNQTPACRALANQLMDHLQADKFSDAARLYCYRLGLSALAQTLRILNEGKSVTSFVGPATVSDILDVVHQHSRGILSEVKTAPNSDLRSEVSGLCLDVIQQALSLDCLSLAVDRELLSREKPLQQERGTQSHQLWRTAVNAVNSDSSALAINVLLAARQLVGLENFVTKAGTMLPKGMKQYNYSFNSISRFVCETLERFLDCSQDELRSLLESPSSTSAIISTLFSSDPETRQAAVELLKAISSQNGRREALGHILIQFYSTTLPNTSNCVRRVAHRKVFAPASSMLKLATDVVDVLCNAQDGILRSRPLTAADARNTELFWQSLWQALTVIFEMTESWSNVGHDKTLMMDFCRDTMQFADSLYDQYSIFASALKNVQTDPEGGEDRADTGERLLQHPKVTMGGMVKWLRLRDEYLSSKAVTLTSKLLVRLHEVCIEVAEESLTFVEDIVTGKIRSKLSGQQQAELQRALETHTGHPLTPLEEHPKPQKQRSLDTWANGAAAQKKGVIDLDKWRSRAKESPTVTTDDDSTGSEQLNKIIADSSRTADLWKARQAAKQTKTSSVVQSLKKPDQRNVLDAAEFKRQRQQAVEAKKKRDAELVALAKRNNAVGGLTAEAGSSLQGLGVMGKDHAAKGTGMMVSSDEESEDEDDVLDRELFGRSKPSKRDTSIEDAKLKALRQLPQGPVKKQRLVRSAKDMRARLAPDLTLLHKTILSWDYFHDGDFPPNSRPEMYSAVPNTFRTPLDYQNTFQPLLTLEAWQGFVKAREESNFKPFEVKVSNRSSVDAFVEVSTTMSHADNKDIMIGEGDIVLMSKAQSPATASDAPHCLARVWRITRKKNHLEILYRVVPGSPLIPSLVPNATVHGAKIQSLTPLEREYGALVGLQYYDLCDEIIKAKPSPLLNYNDKQLEPIIGNYNLNKAQAKAVKSAMDNDAFTLIQGPPGSGKTKTIVAIVGALLTGTLQQEKGTVIERPRNVPGANGLHARNNLPPPKKMLVCAPSNAAVDELVMRFKEGVKTTVGQHKKLSVVRLGRSDAINANVADVTLDQLVNAKLNTTPGQGSNQREETQKLMKEHQGVSEKLREARERLDQGDAKGDEAVKLKDEFDALRRRKTQLSTQIDSARDNENVMNRQAELNRRRAQQAVLDEAHVICATLSGSGHEMFQNLNIEFETVVVDEAAQCVEMSALIPLKYGCAKCILVGDPKQLPPTVFSKEAARFQYEQSLFVRMQGNHPNDVHLLDTQYRMHPEISAFPSQAFYDGRLHDGPNMAALREQPWHASALLGPYRFFDVQGQHQAASKGHSLINLAEIDVAMALFERLTADFKDCDFKGKIGIITPYKSQLRELKERFSRKHGQAVSDTVEFNTTDAYQGRESEIIIFSCVRASPAGGIGFLQDIRRMNVGLTRAKSSLWVLGNSQSLERGEYWRKLVEDARSRGRYTQGNVLQMLQRPSATPNGGRAAPLPPKGAPTGSTNISHRPSVDNMKGVKQEQRSRSSSTSNGEVKPKVKPKVEHLPSRSGLATNGSAYHKPGSAPYIKKEAQEPVIKIEEDRKRKTSHNTDSDVEMKDAPSDADSVPSKTSGNPVTMPGSVEPTDDAMPKARYQNESKGAPVARTNSSGGITKPNSETSKPRMAVPKRKKEVDPFIKPNRPKKPRPN